MSWKTFLSVVIAFASLGASHSLDHSNDIESSLQNDFISFTRRYNKQYATDEIFERFEIFKSNTQRIARHNSLSKSSKLAMNHFGDRTSAEISELFSAAPSTQYFSSSKNIIGNSDSMIDTILSKAPDSVDWRHTLPPARTQGVCTAGYALAATAAVESALYSKMKDSQPDLVPKKLSEQQLVDCTAFRCRTGSPVVALNYLRQYRGHVSFAEYPYSEDSYPCEADMYSIAAVVDDVVHVNTTDSNIVESIVSRQPITASVAGSSFAFMFYAEGVIEEKDCEGDIDHSVLIAGYGVDPVSGKNYWLIRNSFSWAWGIQGYAMLERSNGTQSKNTCQVISNSHKAFPIVSLPN